MDYKLVAIDLDGTLLNSKNHVSEQNKTTVAHAIDIGTHVVICTGRPFKQAHKFASELGVTESDEYIIDYGGNMIQKYTGETIFQQTLHNRDCEIISKFLIEHKVDFKLIDNAGNLYESNQEWTEKRMLNPQLSVLKALMHVHKNKRDQLADLLHNQFDKDYFIVKTAPEEVELCPKDVNKGSGLKELIKYLKLSQKEVMVIGDMDNDLPMMKLAGLSVAMGNAADNIKNACDVVTLDNDHDGVSAAIEKYILNK